MSIFPSSTKLNCSRAIAVPSLDAKALSAVDYSAPFHFLQLHQPRVKTFVARRQPPAAGHQSMSPNIKEALKGRHNHVTARLVFNNRTCILNCIATDRKAR